MSDYQAIYDAVRSRISGGNVAEAIRHVAQDAFDISYAKDAVRDAFLSVAYEMQRPSVLFRPKLRMFDSNKWEAIYGGCCGEGKTAAEAMTNFDARWYREI